MEERFAKKNGSKQKIYLWKVMIENMIERVCRSMVTRSSSHMHDVVCDRVSSGHNSE